MKSKHIENFLEGASEKLALPRSLAKKTGGCVSCGGDAKRFTSYLSEREYNISLLCQRCQDEVFYNQPQRSE